MVSYIPIKSLTHSRLSGKMIGVSKQILGAIIILVIATTPTAGDIRLLWADTSARWWLLAYVLLAGYAAWHFHTMFDHDCDCREDHDGR